MKTLPPPRIPLRLRHWPGAWIAREPSRQGCMRLMWPTAYGGPRSAVPTSACGTTRTPSQRPGSWWTMRAEMAAENGPLVRTRLEVIGVRLTFYD